jgi:hypothetical protein
MGGIKFQCANCGQNLEAPAEAAGCELACPRCQSPVRVPNENAASQPADVTNEPSRLLCAICQSPLQATDEKSACPTCQAEYHADCWTENGGCAIYGCAAVPQVEQRRSIEIPISYWGKENKPCPRCNREILAAAVRCRHCGATFASARPEDSGEFQERTALEERLPGMKRMIICIFALSVIPCCAPIGAIWGLVWFLTHRQHLGVLPAIYPALCKIGLAVGIGQSVLVLVMAGLYSLTQPN